MKESFSKINIRVLLSFILMMVLIFHTNSERENFPVKIVKYGYPAQRSEQRIMKNDLIRKKLNSMALHDKIAQMIISSSFGEDYDENSPEFTKLKKLCTETKIGGFIFFKGSAYGYAALSNKLQSLSETPLLISADFERGTGMRVTDGSQFPNNMALGATDDPELAYKMGFIIAKESRALGVQQVYAPVCDVNNNPDNPIINVRSFGEDPQLVSKMSGAEIKGLQEGNVIATAKHFPGHGDTEIDSHNDLPVLRFSMQRLDSIELVPFKNAIKDGVGSVMIAHLSFPELETEPNVPSSLSKKIVNDLLMNRLGFKGLVVTDALNMKGIKKYFTPQQVAVMCVTAGIDLILMPADEEASIDAIEKAVKYGLITEARINASVDKILRAKEKLGLFKNKLVDEDRITYMVNTAESKELAQQIADKSVTLVKDDNNIMPLTPNKERITIYNLSDGSDNINSSYFNLKIKDEFPDADIHDINSELEADSIGKFTDNTSPGDAVIINLYAKVKYGTGRISIFPSQTALINSLALKTKRIIVISLGNPYLLKEFPSVPCYIAAYGDADVSVNAVIKAISGEIHFKGKLPVTLTGNYRFGMGIAK
jgi:beta-N-acetylhexosaminidase